MGPVDELLQGLGVQRAMVGRSLVSPPWSLSLDTGDPVVLCAMVAGSGWLRRSGQPPERLAEGAVAVVVDGAPVVISDEPTTPPLVVVTGPETCFDAATGAEVAAQGRRASRTWGAADAPVSVLLASYRTEGERFHALAADLPGLLLVADDPVARSTLDAVAAETGSDQPGQQVVFDKLMELLLVTSVRAWLGTADRHPPSWYLALADPLVAPALEAIHEDPARPWTVAALAATTAQSRAAFAQRFRTVVGEPPMAYLTRWRLAWAADLLAAGATVEHAARTVGYQDPYAFSTAFRRRRGTTPSHHRRAHRAAPAVGTSQDPGGPARTAADLAAAPTARPESHGFGRITRG